MWNPPSEGWNMLADFLRARVFKHLSPFHFVVSAGNHENGGGDFYAVTSSRSARQRAAASREIKTRAPTLKVRGICSRNL